MAATPITAMRLTDEDRRVLQELRALLDDFATDDIAGSPTRQASFSLLVRLSTRHLRDALERGALDREGVTALIREAEEKVRATHREPAAKAKTRSANAKKK